MFSVLCMHIFNFMSFSSIWFDMDLPGPSTTVWCEYLLILISCTEKNIRVYLFYFMDLIYNRNMHKSPPLEVWPGYKTVQIIHYVTFSHIINFLSQSLKVPFMFPCCYPVASSQHVLHLYACNMAFTGRYKYWGEKTWKGIFLLTCWHIRLVLGGVAAMCHSEAPGCKHLFICSQHMLTAGCKQWFT